MQVGKIFRNLMLVMSGLHSCAILHAEEALPPAKVNVEYSTRIGEGVLKEVPQEVKLIRRAETQKVIGSQIALNALLFVTGGGLGAWGFSKEDLKGVPFPDVENRSNLKNPVAEEYVQTLKSRINTALDENPAYKDKVFKHPVTVGGGYVVLVYESLTGEQVTYFLKLDLLISKRKESAGMLSFNPLVNIDCSGRSEQSMALESWAKENYQGVASELQKMLDGCSKKVIAKLDDLLAQ